MLANARMLNGVLSMEWLGLGAGEGRMEPTTFENCKAYEFEPAVQERVNLVVAAKVAAERERCAAHVAKCAIPGHSSLAAFQAAHERIISGVAA